MNTEVKKQIIFDKIAQRTKQKSFSFDKKINESAIGFGLASPFLVEKTLQLKLKMSKEFTKTITTFARLTN